MKSLRQIVEVKKIDIVPDPDMQSGEVSDFANPKSEAEKNFVGKHKDNVQHQLHPAFKTQAEQDAVFKGEGIKKDTSKAASYHDGEDVDVYESAIAMVQEALTEENLIKFNQLLEDDFQTAANFAYEVAQELADDE